MRPPSDGGRRCLASRTKCCSSCSAVARPLPRSCSTTRRLPGARSRSSTRASATSCRPSAPPTSCCSFQGRRMGRCDARSSWRCSYPSTGEAALVVVVPRRGAHPSQVRRGADRGDDERERRRLGISAALPRAPSRVPRARGHRPTRRASPLRRDLQRVPRRDLRRDQRSSSRSETHPRPLGPPRERPRAASPSCKLRAL